MGLKICFAVVWAKATMNLSQCSVLALHISLSLSFSVSLSLALCFWCGAHAERALDNAYWAECELSGPTVTNYPLYTRCCYGSSYVVSIVFAHNNRCRQ